MTDRIPVKAIYTGTDVTSTILTLTKVDVGMMEDVGTSANQLVQLDSNAKVPTFPAYIPNIYIPNIVAQNYKYI